MPPRQGNTVTSLTLADRILLRREYQVAYCYLPNICNSIAAACMLYHSFEHRHKQATQQADECPKHLLHDHPEENTSLAYMRATETHNTSAAKQCTALHSA